MALPEMLNGGLHRHQQELGNTDQPLVTQTSLPIKDTLNSPQQHTTWSLSNCSLSRHHGHPSLPSPLPSVFSKESSCRLSLPSSFLCCSCRRHFVKSPPQSLSTTGCVLYVCVVCVCTCVCVCTKNKRRDGRGRGRPLCCGSRSGRSDEPRQRSHTSSSPAGRLAEAQCRRKDCGTIAASCCCCCYCPEALAAVAL